MTNLLWPGDQRAGELMSARSATRHVPAIRVARMFAHGGDTDRAMMWLARAYENRESSLARVGVFWDWDDLRSDRRIDLCRGFFFRKFERQARFDASRCSRRVSRAREL